MRLHVEDEIRRSTFDPTLRQGAIGDRVEPHVGFDERETRRIVAEPILGCFHLRGIEDAARRERLVGPTRGTDADVGAVDRQTAPIHVFVRATTGAL
jgi:hypothetical protein